MTGSTAFVLGGALVTLPYLAWIRRARTPARPAALGLVIAALVYLAFAAAAGAWDGLAVEAVGLILFALVAGLGLRWPWLLALGWAAHAGWDLALHSSGPQDYAPFWYPPACVGSDLLLAGFLVALFWPDHNHATPRETP